MTGPPTSSFLRRPWVLAGLALVVVLALTGVVAGVLTRSDVTWKAEVDGASEVRDWDADRILVETGAEELVVLDREDGSELGRFVYGAERSVEQVVLVPGGLVVQTVGTARTDGAMTEVRAVSDTGEVLWTHEEQGQLRLRGVRVEDGVVALSVRPADDRPRTGRFVGLDLDDGSPRWELPYADPDITVPSGALLRELAVAPALPDGARPTRSVEEAEVIDLADGAVLGSMPVTVGDAVAAWGDVVVSSVEGRLERSVAGRDAAIVGEQPDDVRFLGPVADAAAGVSAGTFGEDERWGLDLEAGTVARLQVVSEGEVEPGRTVGRVDDDGLALGDLADGQEVVAGVGSGEDGPVVGMGRDDVLLVEPVGRLLALRHGLDHERAGRLVVVDRAGEKHGAWFGTTTETAGFAVLDDHEAVILTSGFEDRGADGVVLIGR